MINLSLNKKVIIFGFIFTFFSSFGQSFFLGLFNAPIRNELGITHGQFGNIYATATIFSSLLLIWVGKKIDEYQIIYYSFFVILLLFLSTLFFSFINSIYLLAFGIFLMRFSGQGLMSHTSTTTISRFFERSRGKALSTIWFGLSSAFTETTGNRHWHSLLKARAIENFCYIFAPAQGGTHYNGRKTFGHTMIVSPDGNILKELKKSEGVITASIDPNLSKKLRSIIPSLNSD